MVAIIQYRINPCIVREVLCDFEPNYVQIHNEEI